MPRLLKQFIYGFFYLVLLGMAAVIFYLVLRPSETCFDGIQNQTETGIDCGDICGIDCELKYVQPLVISRPMIFKSDGLISFIAQIKNPNLHYGSDRFEYKINFYDAQNSLLDSLDRTSFIYAGEAKNIIEAAVRVPGFVYRGEAIVDLATISWKPSSDWQAPILDTIGIKSVLKDNGVAVSGSVKNPSNFLISKIAISAIFKDGWGTPLAVSKTTTDNLSPFQERSFQIFSPISSSVQKSIDLKATQILIEARK